MNLGGDPWLPPPDPSPREILRKFAALKKSISASGMTIDEKDTQLAALSSQLAAAGMDIAGLRAPSETLAELDRELKRSKRHRHPMAAVAIAIDPRKGQQGEITDQLHLLSTVISPHCRAEDLLGMIDAKRMAVFLPETGFESGRIFAERIRNAIRSGFGMPPVLIYLTALDKEGEVNAQSFSVNLSRAMEKMAADEKGPDFAFNTTGAISWR